MNQTYYTIANLNKEDSYKIFLRCLNFFTNLNIKEENKGKSKKQIQREIKLVNNFKTLLCYLGEFRNLLAHNQPIYCYNILEYNPKGNNKFKYELPKTSHNIKDKNGNIIPVEKQQINLMGSLMNSLQEYFGKDAINLNNSTKLNLSKIIYILYKILKHIDSNTNFYEELTTIYSKYNIVLSNSKFEIEQAKNILVLNKEIEELAKYNMETLNIIESINSQKPYKKKLKNKDRELKELIKKIKNTSRTIKVNEINPKYKYFPAQKTYSEFTGIDLNFFKNMK